MTWKQFSDSFGRFCKQLPGFMMTEMLFFTTKYIGKRIYDERLDFGYSYVLSFSDYSAMLVYLLEFDLECSRASWSFYIA